MADVYVEVGIVKRVANNYLASAQAAMKEAITAAVNKVGSGMTMVKPSGGKGIQVNVLVMKLVQDGSNVNCNLIGEMFELPSRERFNPGGGSAKGEGKVAGKIDDVAGACVGAAVADLMGKIGSALAGSQAEPASTGTANSKSPLIYIAPFDVSYPTDPNAAPLVLAMRTKTAIADMMGKKIKANSKRFTQDSTAFKVGSGMPAYVIGMRVESVAFDASAKEMVAKTKGYVAEHPSGAIRVASALGKATQSRMTKAPRDDEKVGLLVDAAEIGTETAIKWILQTHP